MLTLSEQKIRIGLNASYFAVGLGLGLGSGVFLAKKALEKKLDLKYNEIMEREIADAKKFYGRLHKKDEYSSPEKVARELGLDTVIKDPVEEDADEALVAYKGERDEAEDISEVMAQEMMKPEVITEKDLPPQVQNIFENAKVDEDDFDYDVEITLRGGIKPYVLSHDEFMENDGDNSQVTITYYDEDDVLTDERDQPIPDVNATVGSENLNRFGHGSKDANIVYVRNPRLDLDFEIMLSHGSYAKEVLGFIEHSDRRGSTRKFRGDDE